ncbi:energy-coupling factor transporter transmembrane protein EcfT [Nakamurella silvestris]|nr:energy-coupling factor transporter transmembrane protein EcfT [Nakamurella silvestris]
MIGLYLPGRSLVHRMSAGAKLASLAVALILLVLLDHPWQMGVAALVAAGLYVLARVPWRAALGQLRPLLWILIIVAGLQLLFADWQKAVMVTGVMLISAALAGLLTLTTPVPAILDLCQRMLRPLQRFGVNPDRVGLAMALTIRCIPLMAGIVKDVTEARKARGVTGWRGSIIALAAPAVVRALRAADALGEALIARGADD